jgi:hypothetical protein
MEEFTITAAYTPAACLTGQSTSNDLCFVQQQHKGEAPTPVRTTAFAKITINDNMLSNV